DVCSSDLMSAPDASCAACITWLVGYLPVPMISRDANSRPAMTNGSMDSDYRSCQSPVASRQLLVASSQSPVSSRQSPVASRQLPVTSRQSPVASCQLPVASNQ